MPRLAQVLTDAFDYFELHGFQDSEQVNEWVRKIEAAVRDSMTSQAELERMLKAQFKQKFEQTLKSLTNHPGVSRFTVQQFSPTLRMVLDKRIMASINLIKLNRDDMVGTTLRRLVGWISSIPESERLKFDRAKLREKISDPLKKLPWAERRVFIDQGHKLVANVNATVAEGGGAIAAKWLSHWRQEGYDYRESHKDRDGVVYLIRNSWAVKDGLVKKIGQWSDEITQPAEEPFCRCKFVYLYHLRQLPPELLTAKGQQALTKAKAA